MSSIPTNISTYEEYLDIPTFMRTRPDSWPFCQHCGLELPDGNLAHRCAREELEEDLTCDCGGPLYQSVNDLGGGYTEIWLICERCEMEYKS